MGQAGLEQAELTHGRRSSWQMEGREEAALGLYQGREPVKERGRPKLRCDGLYEATWDLTVGLINPTIHDLHMMLSMVLIYTTKSLWLWLQHHVALMVPK